MSINPVQPVSIDQVGTGVGRYSANTTNPPDPTSGTLPNQNIHRPQGADASAETTEDEVQVQRDSQTNGEIVIRYLDQTGNLILQVPSAQVLDVTRGITQALEKAIKPLNAAGAASSGNEGSNNGH